jgi:Cytochrome c554 and c-prime
MRARLISFAAFLSVPLIGVLGSTPQAQDSAELRAPSAFAGITDPQARSRALFTEAAKVIMNPRCMSCHPATARPTQGNDMHEHFRRARGCSCQTCHTDRNFTLMERASYQSTPGHPRWDVAPIEMHGKESLRVRFASKSRTPSAMAGAALNYCRIAWPKIISSPGRGIQALGAIRSPARRRDWVNWYAPGSTAARPVLKILKHLHAVQLTAASAHQFDCGLPVNEGPR